MIEFHKLVRDRIPEIITADGQRPVVTVLTPPERRPALLAKLAEEAAEAAAASQQDLPRSSPTCSQWCALCPPGSGSPWSRSSRSLTPSASRGGFDDGVFLMRTEPAADSTP